MHLESWGPLIGLYETGQCHARVLQLRHCYIYDSPHALRAAFTNPESKIAQCVRELTLDVPDMGQATGLFVAHELLGLLQNNQTLQYVDFGVPVVYLSPIGTILDFFRGEIITSKLPIKSKLAFLSVITLKSDEFNVSSCNGLDSLAISRIFEYAGKYMRRSVSIGPCLPVPGHPFGMVDDEDGGDDDDEEEDSEDDGL
ncbi:hypothetical protein Poli38472_001302 [Pythium oligandrum]|uniref:Uncharacterized protein n=1 Tax=Pythium oligandrum TaxID=41045 RepID=A0A8K1CV13_PYTOL|nr:hypothetical protein Poli38472_001302 [Pythium oligandrum]|eukprot:TMW69146.1 hypothetical protein Poli38472_001302 [Pythium oligandrum]